MSLGKLSLHRRLRRRHCLMCLLSSPVESRRIPPSKTSPPAICPGRYLLLATTGSIDLMTLMGRHSPTDPSFCPYFDTPLDALFIDLTLQYRWHILSLLFFALFGALNAFLYP